MSLLLSGVQRLRSLVLMVMLVLVTGSTMSLGVPSASSTEGVTVSPGEPQCSALFRTVTNNTSQPLSVLIYEIKNEQRTDYPFRWDIAPGVSSSFNTMGLHFSQSLGVKTGGYVSRPGLEPVFEWTDWGAAQYVLPSDCPPMVAPARVTKRTKSFSEAPRPLIFFKSTAYATEFGYRVGNKGIRWDRSTWYREGLNTSQGPFMKPGQSLGVKFYSRNVDDSEKRTPAVYLGKKTFTRAR